MPRTSNKSKQKVKKDPNKPKRAMAPFMFFSNSVREQVKRERPDLSFVQIGSEIGTQWKALSDEDKEPYIEMASKDKERYEEEKEHYIPDPSYSSTSSNKKRKDPNAPKRSLSAYLFFCNEYRADCQKQYPDKKITEIASELAAQWRELPEKKKLKYNLLAAKDKQRYEDEMVLYKGEG